jgi:hypothetical protein
MIFWVNLKQWELYLRYLIIFIDSSFLDIYETKSVGIIMLRVQTLENDKRIA